MDNISTNISDNDSSGASVDVAVIFFSSACFIIAIWCVILNGLLVLCFWINKRESWYSHSKNILSITITDLLAGLTILTALMSSMKSNINIYECLVTMGLCLASQTATSLNVLRFCVTRFYSIKQTSIRREHSASIIVAQTLIIWFVSSTAVLVPLIFWSENQQVLKRCRWTYLFSTYAREVDLYMLHVLALPTMTTTVLYGILSVKLRQVRNFIHPSTPLSAPSTRQNQNSSGDSKPTGNSKRRNNLAMNTTEDKLSSEHVCHTSCIRSDNPSKKSESETPATTMDTMKSNLVKVLPYGGMESEASMMVVKGSVSGDHDTLHNYNINHHQKRENGTLRETSAKPRNNSQSSKKTLIHGLEHFIDSDTNKRTTASEKDTRYLSLNVKYVSDNVPGNQPKVLTTKFNARANMKKKTYGLANRTIRMNKVIATFDVILLLINISNLPYIVLIALRVYDPDLNVPAVVGIISLFSLMLNSAFNPIIYAVRLRPLRIAFLNMFKHCYQFVCKTNCRNP